MPIFRHKGTGRKRFAPLNQNSNGFNTANLLGFPQLKEGWRTLHCCFHLGNNTRFPLNRLCRWLSDLLGHFLPYHQFRWQNYMEKERRALLKTFIEHLWKHSSYCSLNTCFVSHKLLSDDRLPHAQLPAAAADVEPLLPHGSWWSWRGAGCQPDNVVASA